MKLRSKPFQDKEGPATTSTTFGTNFVCNFGSFDSLPLVEFVPDPSIPPVRVKELLRQDPPAQGGGRGDGWNARMGDQEQVLSNEGIENDLFAQCLLENTEHQTNPEDYKPVTVTGDIMQSMRFEEVFI